jgi:hypothetical protein
MVKSILLILSVFILLQAGCEIDHGLAPIPGKLRARVAFRGTPPEDTQGVYMIVAPQFPPHAINELYQSPNSLPVGQDTVYTEIDLPYGHYEAFGLWWYSKDTRSNLADILALPHDGITGEPIGFDLSPEEPIAEKVMHANWGDMNRDAALKGTVYFDGDFPSNTNITAVAAFSGRPITSIHYLVWLRAIDITIETGVRSHQFNLPVKSGHIGYIAIFWLAENAPIYDIKIIADARDPSNPEKVWSKTLHADETVEGIEIHVDWNNPQPVFPEETP